MTTHIKHDSQMPNSVYVVAGLRKGDDPHLASLTDGASHSNAYGVCEMDNERIVSVHTFRASERTMAEKLVRDHAFRGSKIFMDDSRSDALPFSPPPTFRKIDGDESYLPMNDAEQLRLKGLVRLTQQGMLSPHGVFRGNANVPHLKRFYTQNKGNGFVQFRGGLHDPKTSMKTDLASVDATDGQWKERCARVERALDAAEKAAVAGATYRAVTEKACAHLDMSKDVVYGYAIRPTGYNVTNLPDADAKLHSHQPLSLGLVVADRNPRYGRAGDKMNTAAIFRSVIFVPPPPPPAAAPPSPPSPPPRPAAADPTSSAQTTYRATDSNARVPSTPAEPVRLRVM